MSEAEIDRQPAQGIMDGQVEAIYTPRTTRYQKKRYGDVSNRRTVEVSNHASDVRQVPTSLLPGDHGQAADDQTGSPVDEEQGSSTLRHFDSSTGEEHQHDDSAIAFAADADMPQSPLPKDAHAVTGVGPASDRHRRAAKWVEHADRRLARKQMQRAIQRLWKAEGRTGPVEEYTLDQDDIPMDQLALLLQTIALRVQSLGVDVVQLVQADGVDISELLS